MNFIDDTEQLLFNEFDIGLKCADFLRTEVGRYLYGVARQTVQECAIELLDCDFSNAEAIAKLQIKAATARNFIGWLEEAIANGENAGQQLATYRDAQ